MHPFICRIISDYNPAILNKLDDALELKVTNFKRDLFPSLEKIDREIPGAGFQYVLWKNHEARYPFPGWEFDHISRPMKYIPTYLASGMKFPGMARSIAHLSGSHLEDCIKMFCEKQLPSIHIFMTMPLGMLTKQQILIEMLGDEITKPANDLAIVLVNKAKHEFRTGSPLPLISFPDALGGYFASRILSFQVLQKADILDSYVVAIRSAFEKRIVYTFPEDSDPGDDPEPWPLQSGLSALEDDIGEY
jgi:hypothetical protein